MMVSWVLFRGETPRLGQSLAAYQLKIPIPTHIFQLRNNVWGHALLSESSTNM